MQRAQTRNVPYPDLHIAHAFALRSTPELQLVGGEGSRASAGDVVPTVRDRLAAASTRTIDAARFGIDTLRTGNFTNAPSLGSRTTQG
ncbi:hypothetical protein GCM10027269_29230 [Kribbella endophytica]